MRYQLLLHYYLPVALFVLILVFQKPLKQYAAANPKRLWLVGAAFLFGSLIGLLFLVPYSIYFFFKEYKAAQAVADIASSKIASAAQGYTEIVGQGLVSGAARSPVSRLPCLWYSYSHYKTNGLISRLLFGLDSNDWALIDSGTHDDIFVISDGSASCYVNPKGAQVSNLDYQEWYDGNNFYKEARLIASQDLYVLGNFITQTSAQLRTDLSKQVGELIAQWKLDQTSFKSRFDLDDDGQISEQELALVRAAALRELDKNGVDLTPKTTISKPADGRPFVLSHHPHNKLINRHKLHSYFYIGLFLLSSLLLSAKLLPQKRADENTYPKGWPALVLDKYRLSCTDLSGTYAIKPSVGNIRLSETFIGNRVEPQAHSPVVQYFRDWDTFTLSKNKKEYGGAQNYTEHFVVLTLQRSPKTMQAFETELKQKAPAQYAQFQEISSKQTRQKASYTLPGRNLTIAPAQLSDAQFGSYVDDEFFWHTNSSKMKKDSPEYQCDNGRVTRYLKADKPMRTIKVALTKDIAGNLIAKKFYTEPNKVAGIILDDKITVLDWSRWTPTKPARADAN